MKNFLVKNSKLNVDIDKNLIPFLNKTSKGTKYWDSPPKSEPSNFQFGRVLLQIHQILFLSNLLKIDLNNKNFLDVGTGNAMIPKLISEIADTKESMGIDPYQDGEHQTSWQKHNHKKFLKKILNFFRKKGYYELNYNKYRKYLKQEQHIVKPETIKFKIKKGQNFSFKKIDINKTSKLNLKFDFIYCKALEHISDYKSFFKQAGKCLKKGGYIYLKHRSFFSYLGAHRYSSTGIPFGHVLLSEKEYIKYCKKFHTNRYEKMINFYFNDLSYPRHSVSQIIKIANQEKLVMNLTLNEANKNIDKIFSKINKIKNFWDIVKRNFPDVSSEELLSGMYHIVLKKK